ncbi:cell wall-binding repeat-containing protein [Paradesulfitobacterium aromaticivorans]
MSRKLIGIGLSFLSIFSLVTTTATAAPEARKKVLSAAITSTRLAGQTRYQTARTIAEQTYKGTVQNIVLASGNGFADALAASTLAHKLNAPILLVDQKVENSSDAFDYIQTHRVQQGNVWIIGGYGVIGTEFEDKLKMLGLQVKRIAGSDRYETASLIANATTVPTGTPIVIASGENYPDALSISSFAAFQGWPILLVMQDNLPDKIGDFITSEQPAKVYIAGGEGVVSKYVEAAIKSITPNTEIKRFAGQDRYATTAQIVSTFAPKARTVYAASGDGFADALAGSTLAAREGSPIILLDPNLSSPPPAILRYLVTLDQANMTAFGGSGALPESLVQNVNSVLNPVITPVQTPIDGIGTVNSYKFSSNVAIEPNFNSDLLFISAATGSNFTIGGYSVRPGSSDIYEKAKTYFSKYANTSSAKTLYDLALGENNPPHKFIAPLYEMLTYGMFLQDNTLYYQISTPGVPVIDTVSQFAKDTDATTFFKDNLLSYNNMVKQFVEGTLNFNYIKREEGFFGISLDKDQFEVVLSPFMNGGQAMTLYTKDGTRTNVVVINATDADALYTIYHETAHNYYDVRNDYPDLVSQFRQQYANALGSVEPDFDSQLNETIIRAVSDVLIAQYHGEQSAQQYMNSQLASGYTNTDNIYYLIKNKYLPNRDQYSTFHDFVPVIFDFLKATSLNQPFDVGPKQ